MSAATIARILRSPDGFDTLFLSCGHWVEAHWTEALIGDSTLCFTCESELALLKGSDQ